MSRPPRFPEEEGHHEQLCQVRAGPPRYRRPQDGAPGQAQIAVYNTLRMGQKAESHRNEQPCAWLPGGAGMAVQSRHPNQMPSVSPSGRRDCPKTYNTNSPWSSTRTFLPTQWLMVRCEIHREPTSLNRLVHGHDNPSDYRSGREHRDATCRSEYSIGTCTVIESSARSTPLAETALGIHAPGAPQTDCCRERVEHGRRHRSGHKDHCAGGTLRGGR